MTPPRIEDYALIGDLQTAGLVDRRGSIDWLCFPRFDSGACFAALLGDESNGRWALAPVGRAEPTRRYLHDTLVLETTWTSGDHEARVLDFMPPRGEAPDVVRIVEGVRGRMRFRSELVLRFDYGSIVPWVRRSGDARVAIGGPDAVTFRTPAPTRGENLSTITEFTVDEGERVPFVLTWFPSHRDAPRAIDPEHALSDTEEFWRDWGERSAIEAGFRDAVHRSLIVLKALTYGPTGAVVAAPTTSLPEQIGGVRNWDYRFCWLRDATLVLLALINAGYEDEARDWRAWLLRAAAGDPADLQIMYGVAGERRLLETELSWLPGYEGSAPVRIGNAASEQRQLDVYGEVIDALYQARTHGLPEDAFAWSLQVKLLEYLADVWRLPDRGIWEIRGEPRHFVHSKVMAWVAFDRGVRSAESHGMTGPVDSWRRLREEIHEEVCREGFDEELGSFTQSYGSKSVDAALLLLPLVGFLPCADRRVAGTVEAIERVLLRDGLVARYLHDGVDGLPPGEGVFLPCSFWLVHCLALLGRRDEAERLFKRLLGLANDVGLLAEEYDPEGGRMLGNFPQALTHLALVNAGFTLARDHVSLAEKRHAR